MNKTIKVLYLFLLLGWLSACTNQLNNNVEDNNAHEQNRKEYSGKIIIVGSEPFTKPAIMVNDSLVITLECDKKTENHLRKNQGSYFKIAGIKNIEGNGEQKLTIISAKKIRK